MRRTGAWPRRAAFFAVTFSACTPSGADVPRAIEPSPPAPHVDAGPLPEASTIDAASATRPSDLDASATNAAVVFPPPPEGATRLLFRDVLVGALPYPARRTTFELFRRDRSATLRATFEVARGSLPRIDASTHDTKLWQEPVRVAWEGEVTGTAPMKLSLRRVFGPEGTRKIQELPSIVELTCKTESVRVHPEQARLDRGSAGGGGVGRGVWSPRTLETVPGALVCIHVQDTPGDLLMWFTKAFVFVPPREGTHAHPADGVEHAFANDDMVLQEGGLRFVPRATP